VKVRLTRTSTCWPAVTLTERQWDIVRDALYQRGTAQAKAVAEKIWRQGGGTQRYDGQVEPQVGDDSVGP
jgi:hypothetical protein